MSQHEGSFLLLARLDNFFFKFKILLFLFTNWKPKLSLSAYPWQCGCLFKCILCQVLAVPKSCMFVSLCSLIFNNKSNKGKGCCCSQTHGVKACSVTSSSVRGWRFFGLGWLSSQDSEESLWVFKRMVVVHTSLDTTLEALLPTKPTFHLKFQLPWPLTSSPSDHYGKLLQCNGQWQLLTIKENTITTETHKLLCLTLSQHTTEKALLKSYPIFSTKHLDKLSTKPNVFVPFIPSARSLSYSNTNLEKKDTWKETKPNIRMPGSNWNEKIISFKKISAREEVKHLITDHTHWCGEHNTQSQITFAWTA